MVSLLLFFSFFTCRSISFSLTLESEQTKSKRFLCLSDFRCGRSNRWPRIIQIVMLPGFSLWFSFLSCVSFQKFFLSWMNKSSLIFQSRSGYRMMWFFTRHGHSWGKQTRAISNNQNTKSETREFLLVRDGSADAIVMPHGSEFLNHPGELDAEFRCCCKEPKRDTPSEQERIDCPCCPEREV